MGGITGGSGGGRHRIGWPGWLTGGWRGRGGRVGLRAWTRHSWHMGVNRTFMQWVAGLILLL